MRKSGIFILSFAFAILLSGCSADKKPSELTIKIIETSDVHGAIFDYDFIQDKKSSGSLSQIQTYLNTIEDKNNLVLLDNGDILQGQPVVYYFNFQNVTDSHIVSRVLNYMNYDAVTFGNHDIEAGHDVYDKVINEFEFPVLAANAVRIDNGKPYFEPYTIINRKGFKIAVLGLITPGIPNWLPKELWYGITFEDMVETAKKWVPLILNKEKPDLMVGLFHAGFDYTYANSDENTYRNENASVLVAKQVPGFDVIFIGHDHESWNEKVINIDGKEVLILGPRNNAKQISQATIHFKKSANGKYEKSIESEIVDIAAYSPDSVFDNKFYDDFLRVQEYVSKPIGEFTQPLCSDKALFGPSEFVELIHTVQLDLSKADISFTSSQSFNACINKGTVHIRDMFKLFKYENFLYTINLSGAEIKNYLEYSFGNWFNIMKNESDHLLQFELDEMGNPQFNEDRKSYSLKNMFYNFDVAGGLIYNVDISKPENQSINIISLSNGKQFYPDSVYTVAINSYRGNGGGGILEFGVGLNKDEIVKRRISSTDKDLRFYTIKWIEEKEVVDTDFEPLWNVIPELWWKKAVEKDKKLLNLN